MARKLNIKNPRSTERPILMGYATQRRDSKGDIKISVNWLRLFASLILVAILSWFTMAGALFLHFKHNKEFTEVSYVKMLTLLPFGIEKHRVEMGNYHIERGLSEIQKANYRDALRLLRLGVARAPSNLQGRSVLAEFYEIALKRHDIAADMLIKGLDEGGIGDIEYVKRTLRLLLNYQMDEEIQRIADEYLLNDSEPNDITRSLAFGAANANYLRGNYDRADDYLINYGLLESIEGVLLSSQISWDRGNQISAITKMKESIRRFPNSEPLLMQLSRYHRELDQIDEARRYAILRNVSDPLSPAPRLELLYIYNKSGDAEREQRETQRMLKQFRYDENALKALANFASSTGNIDLARRTYEEALENEFSIDAFALLLIEAHLVEEDFSGAIDFSEELLKERPDWLTSRWAIFNSLRAVASYGIDRPELGEIYLQDYIDDTSTPAATHLAVSRRFSKIDRHAQTRKILTVAYKKSPTNQKLLSELISTELKLGNTENLNRLLYKLLRMRRPDIGLLSEAYSKLGSDRFIFTPERDSLLLELSAILRENTEVLSKTGS